MPAHPLMWIFGAIAKHMALADLLPANTAKLSIVAVSVALLMFGLASSAFTAYAQQGGNASGGAAMGGPGIGGAPCYGSRCNYYNYGGPATGGQANGGAAADNGGNTGIYSASPSPDINDLNQKGNDLYNLGMYNEAIHVL
jgi:hypothetical protein